MSAIKILVTTDGSNLSDKAVETAIGLAEQVGGSVVGMTAVVTSAPACDLADEDEAVRDRLESIGRRAAEAGVPCELVAEHAETVSGGVLACAARVEASYIVMASRGLGTFGALLLGSETQKVLSQADRPVLVVR
ncbi:universal stress protein [Sutterella sp.]|uniref:universal stress protein n=1 Tax=Sutterella sp. TaxID=1981025 RepID=UPI0026E0C5B8|nr:universal stress protein [Sutterella sp.]MDO5530452.1 universal stress protein [Sutterella sp.]